VIQLRTTEELLSELLAAVHMDGGERELCIGPEEATREAVLIVQRKKVPREVVRLEKELEESVAAAQREARDLRRERQKLAQQTEALPNVLPFARRLRQAAEDAERLANELDAAGGRVSQ
jgi:alanyl-tRNA synthetase